MDETIEAAVYADVASALAANEAARALDAHSCIGDNFASHNDDTPARGTLTWASIPKDSRRY